MKTFIAISENKGLDSEIDTRYGRASFFMIYDMDSDKILEVEENKFKEEGHGVGIKTSGLTIEKGCKLMIGAKPGPKAEQVLSEGGVEVFTVTSGTVRDALNSYRSKN